MGDISKPRTYSVLTALGMLIIVISLVTLWIAEILPRTVFATLPGVAPVLDLFFLSLGSYVVFISGGIRHVALISLLISFFTIFLSVGVVLLSTVGGCTGANEETNQGFLKKLQLAAVLTAVTSVLQIFVAKVFFNRDLSLPGGNSDYYYEKKNNLNGCECLGSTLLGFGISAIFFIIFMNETVNSATVESVAEVDNECLWYGKTYYAFVWTEVIFRVHTILYFCMYSRKVT